MVSKDQATCRPGGQMTQVVRTYSLWRGGEREGAVWWEGSTGQIRASPWWWWGRSEWDLGEALCGVYWERPQRLTLSKHQE